MPIACKICIMTRGLRGSQLDSLFQNQEELVEHLESVHHMPVRREGETEEESIQRFLKAHPEARTCPDCIAAGAPWTKEEGDHGKRR
jgi:hypothetical protein